MQKNNVIKIKKEDMFLLDEESIEHLKKSEEDIENGRTYPAEDVFKELREQYGY